MNEVQIVLSWLSPTVLFCIMNLTIATIYILNPKRINKQENEHNPQLIRIPSLFERVKSFNLSTYRPNPQHEPEEISHVTRSESHSETRAQEQVLTETAPEKPVAFDGGGEDETVDEKADDFINRFRKQLKLQRLDSILRYKEMLNRRMGK